MKKNSVIFFYIIIGIFPMAMLLRIKEGPFESLLFALGFLGLLMYFSARTVKDLLLKRNNRFNILLQIFMVLMSVILFSKYLYHSFGDYPGLLIIPLFVTTSVMYLIKGKATDGKLTISVVTYLILLIPLFGLDFYGAPRQYIPQDWYDEYEEDKQVEVVMPYTYQFKETEELSIRAFELKKSNYLDSAILIYRQALKLEPRNPKLLFDMSDCYAEMNDLEMAIAILDTAILIDSSYIGFYNNRGLYHFKLKENDKAIVDFKKAILIDSTQYVSYTNIALAYYNKRMFEESCEAIKKAEKLGIEIDNFKELKRIKNKKCK